MKSRDFVSLKFCILLLIGHRCMHVLCVSDVYGKTFILALPTFRSDRGVYFSMFTLQERKFAVNFATPGGADNDTVNANIWLSRQEPVHYNVKRERKHNGTSITFTYKLSSDHRFRLSVLLKVSYMAVESFQAVPVEGWGKTYFVFSLGPQPSVQIMASQETQANIYLKSSNGRQYTVNYNGVVYNAPSLLPVLLKSNQAFSLQKCANDGVNFGDLNGTKIEGDKPIGVITGSCGGGSYSLYCESRDKTVNPYVHIADSSLQAYSVSTNPSHTYKFVLNKLEMLLPYETYSDEFITLQINRSGDSGYTVFMAAQPETRVHIYRLGARSLREILALPGDTLEVTGPPTYVICYKPVQAVYIQRSRCPEKHADLPVGTVAMTILNPMRFLMDSFFWHTPNDSIVSCQHYVIIVYQEDSLQYIQVDNRSLSSIDRQDVEVIGRRAWKVTNLDIRPGFHAVHSDRNALLGLYLYGALFGLRYIQTAGFKSTKKNVFCDKPVPQQKPGDMLDNDCDGRIDEEKLDGHDDDADEKIDEDTINLPTRHGGWAAWSQWFCKDDSDMTMYRSRECSNPFPSNGGYDCVGADTDSKQASCQSKWDEWSDWSCIECGDKKQARTRHCEDPPCDGFFIETRNAECNIKCPSECPPNKWGLNCTGSCDNCLSGCNKEEGVCVSCKKGFQEPLLSCSKKCGPFTYGANCKWSCKEKCGGVDCIDSVEGTCPGMCRFCRLSSLSTMEESTVLTFWREHVPVCAGFVG
ncbi:hypothetical protein Btru_014828 [Bulinus truncatus]|nr:hypothetical protein Btru_014828 [Bulinus truncatus]